jgi:hypothetical protein
MKMRIFIIVVLVVLSSCKLNYEYVSTNYSPIKLDNPEQVKLFLSERNVPEYQEIGLIRISSYEDELNQIILPAKKIAAENGGDCMLYKQTTVSAQGEAAKFYIYEFIVGVTK